MKRAEPEEKNMIKAMLRVVDHYTPKTGFNVVAVDTFEPPDEALYLVTHCVDKAEADAAAAQHTLTTGDKAYVYSPRVAKP